MQDESIFQLKEIIYEQKIKQQFYSFLQVLSTAIDERTPYNANHTRHLVAYVKRVAQYVNEKYEEGTSEEYFDKVRLEQLEVSAWLHDIGKLVIPREVMNKATRLGDRIEVIRDRFKYIEAMLMIQKLKKEIDEKTWELEISYLRLALEHIEAINSGIKITSKMSGFTIELGHKTYVGIDGSKNYWLEDDEIEALSIIRGTLTGDEIKVMRQHVEMTEKLLSKINFIPEFKNVPYIARSHHEYLDGTGYPRGLKASELSFEARLLAVLDIFEALVSVDRPYKKAKSPEQALQILEAMVKDKKLDGIIVDILKEMYVKDRLLLPPNT